MEPENINCSINTLCRLWWVLTVKNSYRNFTQTPVGTRDDNILCLRYYRQQSYGANITLKLQCALRVSATSPQSPLQDQVL